jgi:hypothetical protein
MNIWTVALTVFILNLPFGYWKASVGRFSLQWFLSIHLPIPLIVVLRLTSGVGWQLYTYPILVGAFFIGHFIGAKLYHWWRKRAQAPITACLIWNLVKELQLRAKK